MTGMHAALVREQQLVGAMLAQALPATPGSAPPGTLVRLAGTAQPGPAGLLRSPEAGAPCVWFRTIVIPIRQSYFLGVPGGAGMPSQGISSATEIPLDAMPGVSGQPAPDDRRSDTPFTIAGPDGGIDVLPAGGHIDSLVQSANADQVQRTMTHRDDRVVVEWIIAPDAPVYAIGFVTDGPDGRRALVAPQGGKVVVSTRDEQALHAMAAHFAGRPAGGGAGLPVGPGGRMVDARMIAVAIGVVAVALLVAVVFLTA